LETFNIEKADLVKREISRMEQELTVGSWTLEEKISLTCRILHSYGHDSGLAGQITARGSQSNTFITQKLGLGFDEISPKNLLNVDEDLNVISGQGMPNPANRFHSWIYRARQDAQCIIHTHPFYTAALSMLEKPLQISHMDTCVLFNDVAFLSKWPGIPVGNEEGEIISSAIGNKRALLLAHHGLVVVGSSVEEACILALQFERAAKLQMVATAVGQIIELDASLGEEAHDWILQGKRSMATFSYYARQLLRKDPNCLN
jgi:L-fuculose-phosphate aldolase